MPVIDGETFDVSTRNPSAGLNSCNTIYNFYAVNKEGVYIPEGKFTLKRSSHESLSGMVLAPQGNVLWQYIHGLINTLAFFINKIYTAHIIDTSSGSFSGQIIANSYESNDNNVQIKDYLFSGNEKCQTFVGCAAAAAQTKPTKKLMRRQGISESTTEQVTGTEGNVTEILPCAYIILD